MNPVKISANLPSDTITQLESISAAKGITRTEVLRQAIALKKFVDDLSSKGAKILVEDADKSIKQVVFH